MTDRDINASEISEYAFCSVAWYLDKEGYRRSGFANTRMTTGQIAHRRMETTIRRSRVGMKFYLACALVFIVATVLYSSGII